MATTPSTFKRLSRRALLRKGFEASVFGAMVTSLAAACAPLSGTSAPATAPPAAARPAGTPASAAAPAAAGQPASGQPKTGGSLRISFVGDPVNVDGHYYSPKAGLGPFIVFDTLTLYDDNLKVQPSLAESWEQSTDGKQLKLNLRKGVTFHSGREFTSADVLYNMTRVLDRKLTAGILTGFVPDGATWEAPDKNTVLVKTSSAWPAVFDWLQVLNIIDKDVMEGPDGKSKAGGTGPFSMVEWVQGDHLTFRKNANYWQSGKPYLDELVVSVAADAASMTAKLEAGVLDLVSGPTFPDFNRLKGDAKYQVQLMPHSGAFHQFQPNVTFKPLDDKRVRQALSYALDRKRINDTVLFGTGKPKSLPWPDDSPAYEQAKNDFYTFDLDKAKSLLQQAGASGLQLDFVFANTLPEYIQMAQIYQADLDKIGVKMNIKQLELGVLFDQIHNQTYNGLYTLSDQWANMEPISLFTSGASANVGGNNAGFKDPHYAELVGQASGEPDASKRRQVYSQINDYLLDQAFMLPIGPNFERLLARANVKNIGHKRNNVWSLTETWLE